MSSASSSSFSKASMTVLAASLWLISPAALAHAFAVPYTLPVPFWMYAYGAVGALLLSFVIVGLFSRIPAYGGMRTDASNVHLQPERRDSGSALVRGFGVAALVLTIATGLFGTQNSFHNFNMTFFWIVFVLGLTYLVALIGDIYTAMNPWLTLCLWIERIWPRTFAGRVRYPAWCGYYPALILYMAFIWLELFGHIRPLSLAVTLCLYTAINLFVAALVGKEAWFRHGEFFSVFFRLVGKMSPIARDYEFSAPGVRRLRRLRKPLVGLLEEPADHFSLVIFVLFMLSSTAFDGLHETLPWVGIFWKGLYPLIDPLVQSLSAKPYSVAARLYYVWQWLSLILTAFVYVAIYLLFILLTKIAVRGDQPVRRLALYFALPLVPIAFVYHFTHYYTLVLSQAPQLLRLVSDPFGVGWDIFGTAKIGVSAWIVDASVIWHTQVGMILLGHVISVYLAHAEAWRIFGTSRRALISQVPMLVLMVSFTAGGLWILSLPIASGQVPAAPGAGAFVYPDGPRVVVQIGTQVHV